MHGNCKYHLTATSLHTVLLIGPARTIVLAHSNGQLLVAFAHVHSDFVNDATTLANGNLMKVTL